MIEAGLFVAIGLLALFAKMSWRTKIWMTSHPVAMDIMVFVGLTAIHFGTFTGVMAATIGALMCSVILSVARKVIGHVEGNVYFPGLINISEKLR